MSDQDFPRRHGFEALWPWPGNIFLVLFAGWAGYMGAVAQLDDIRTAFFGLAAVTVVVLMFGLRSARRPAAPFQSAREAAGLPPRTGREKRAGRGRQPAGSDRFAAADRSLVEMPGTGPVGGAGSEAPMDPVEAALRELEAQINREKAERGAQVAKLETQMNQRFDRMRDEDGVDGGRSIELDDYLRIDAFTAAINERLLPRVGAMITTALDERLSPDGPSVPVRTPAASDVAAQLTALRANLDTMVEAEREERATLRGEIEHLRESVAAARSAASMEGVPDNLGAELASLRSARERGERELAELREAIRAARSAPVVADGAAVPTADIARRLDAVERSLAEREEVAARMVDGMRASVAGVTQQVGRLDEVAGAIIRRIDAMAHPDAADDEPPRTPADVAALRDALSTIISQNHEIRAQQERLSARLDTPLRGGDADHAEG